MTTGRYRVAVLYWTLVTAVILVASELFCRFLLPDSQRYFIWPRHQFHVFEPTEETTPGVSGAGRFQTNSLGLRSDEPPPGRERVVYVFGGSTSIDLYLDQERAWVYQLQTRLNQAPGSPKTWVGNLARSSMATMHNLFMFEHLIPDLPKANIFVNLVGVNDLQLALKSSYLRDMTLADHMSWTFSEMPASGAYWKQLGLVRFYERIGDWRRKAQLGPTQTFKGNGFITWKQCRADAPPQNIVDRLPDLTDALAQYRRNLNELVDRAAAQGGTTIFLTQPTIWADNMRPEEMKRLFTGGIGPNKEWCEKKMYYSPRALAEGMKRYNEVLLDVCTQRALFCIDIAAKVPKTAKYFYDDMHFSDAGADLVSALVADGINRLGTTNQGRLHKALSSTR